MRERFRRSAGILLHPTSFPGPWGIGDLGAGAYQFIDFLARSGQRLWQILPLNPTGFGDSPYQSPSAFAGNPLLISLDRLLEDGLLQHHDLYDEHGQPRIESSPDQIDYDAVTTFKMPVLYRAFERFRQGASPKHSQGFDVFCKEHADWLDDYALFVSIQERYEGASMAEWDVDLRTRKAAALKRAQKELAERIEFRKYMQYLFYSQWQDLKAYANEREILIIGDAPIFVAYDSSDVWANEKLFLLDKNMLPTHVAGVPPDFFSATGQRWGNPLYQWDRMAKQGYDWWIKRLRHTLSTVDILRLDHFRGFESYWEIPSSEETAINGRWVSGPGADFFDKVADALGELPIIAEDLGIITSQVEELRDRFNLPGMKVLQFAFGDDAKNPYLLHNHTQNMVVYTGTHDNDTTIGWFASASERERYRVCSYLGHDGSDIAWELMRQVSMSVCDLAVVPLQDPLRLGTEARTNVPGVTGGNWAWRYRPEMLTDEVAQGLRTYSEMYGRLLDDKPDEEEQA